eukprot:Gregarina_sp_Poly_1__3319@NODE_1955_length_3001_cov_133_145535_g1258_i0_p4_GENE_NODE_1955_length_3001_cov_133_145535_g1258_i0NODE_1955_length_3001_cov_133_145535_g1258_i0_p4_ORF_typecomplete_len177_score30_15KH_6/PF15985_5/2_3e08_NODE_1955_length_3001_cov_133_145535_g1258_i05821112
MEPESFYNPAIGDVVVGVVTQKYAEQWKVNIRAPNEAHLPTTAFVHATKQNFPGLTVGSIVLVGVSSAHKDYDTMLTGMCLEDQKGWSTEETYLGELKGGLAFDVPLPFAHVLLMKECLLLTEIGMQRPYEVAIGANGRVWVKAETRQRTIEIANVIQASENAKTLEELEVLTARL